MTVPSSLLSCGSRQAQTRLIPRLERSISDCGHLFAKFREHLVHSGGVGIVAVNCAEVPLVSEAAMRAIALFIRLMERKLSGRIEGGYRAGDGEYFLLLVPAGRYDEGAFRLDMEVIRRELERSLALPHYPRQEGRDRTGSGGKPAIDGVFLVNREGEKADNVLFRAFQELFSASRQKARNPSPERLEVERIVAGGLIRPVFQPIYALADGSLHGHEALSRIVGPSLFASPDPLFASAAAHGFTSPLEMLCRRKALERAGELRLPGRLFLNVCPELFHAGDHERGCTAALLDRLGIERSRVTFELTERTLIADYDLFLRAVTHYRAQGYTIAVDDLGTGYAGLQMLARLEPEYVKLARFLVAGIHQAPTRQALVEALVAFCARIGAQVIAEGIEEPAELEWLREAGVALGQGYLLARPTTSPPGGSGDMLPTLCPVATAP